MATLDGQTPAMTGQRERFFNQFEPVHRQHLLAFANRVAALDVDVIMPMARKAACLLDALRSLGLFGPNALVVSDRATDFGTAWLEGSTIALIDDSIVSGSSIYRLQRLLEQAKVKSVRTLSYCVNSRWWNSNLAQPENPYQVLSDRESQAFCVQVVQALAAIPRPYNVDWPLFRVTGASDEVMASVKSLPGWRTVHLSSGYQSQNGIEVLALHPSSSVRKAGRDYLGAALSSNPLLKVRVYAERDHARQKWTITFLPIAGMGTQAISSVHSAAGSILSTFNMNLSSIRPEGAYRLVQYAASANLQGVLERYWDSWLPGSTRSEPDRSHTALVFPPAYVGAIQDAVSDPLSIARSLDRNLTTRSTDLGLGRGCDWLLPKPPAQTAETTLTQAFEGLHRERELPARQVLKDQGALAIAGNEPLSGRLLTGYSFAELAGLLSAGRSSQQAIDQEVSTFLDLATDMGIAVPVISSADGLVGRLFRHGEDAVYGAAESRQLVVGLAEVAKCRKEGLLPRILAEKFSVLFVRVGIADNWLQEWRGRLGKANTIGVRHNLYGAVTQLESEHMYLAQSDETVPAQLANEGILDRVEGRYTVAEVSSEVPLTRSREASARALGALVGQVTGDIGGRPMLSATDFGRMVTCATPRTTAEALGAELALVSKGRAALTRMVERLVRISSHHASGSKPAVDRQIQQLQRDKTRRAIHEAHEKIVWYRTHQARSSFDRVAAAFMDAPLYAAAWETVGAALFGSGHEDSQELTGLLSRQMSTLSNLGASNRLLEVAARRAIHAVDPTSDGNALNIAKSYLATAGANDKTAKELKRIISEFHSPATSGLEAYVALSNIAEINRSLLAKCGQLTDESVLRLRSYGRVRNVVEVRTCALVTIDWCSVSQERVLEELVRIVGRVNRGQRRAKLRVVEYNVGDVPGFLVYSQSSTDVDRRALGRLLGRVASSVSVEFIYSAVVCSLLPSDCALFASADGGSTIRGAAFDDFLDEALQALTDGQTGSSRCCELLEFRADAFPFEATKDAILAGIATEATPITPSPSESARSGSGVKVRRLQITRDKVHEVPRVAILTFLHVETNALDEWLQGESATDYARSHRRGVGQRFYRSATLNGVAGPVKILTTQAVDQGGESATLAATDLMNEFNPDLLLAVGIAGSISVDVSLLDVVIAKDVLRYSWIKEGPDGLQFSSVGYRAPIEISSAAEVLAQESAARSATEEGGGGFVIHAGSLGSGPAVIATSASEFGRHLKDFNRKTAAVETEAGALSQALLERGPGARCPLGILRGISDHADVDKDDEYQSLAARNAVRVTEQFIARFLEAPAIAEDLKLT